MTDHAVVIAGGVPTGLMLLASGRWQRRRRRRTTHQPRGSTGREPVVCRPECRDTPVACGKPPGRAARVSRANEKAREARRG
jgi:hypothetical protein